MLTKPSESKGAPSHRMDSLLGKWLLACAWSFAGDRNSLSEWLLGSLWRENQAAEVFELLLPGALPARVLGALKRPFSSETPAKFHTCPSSGTAQVPLLPSLHLWPPPGTAQGPSSPSPHLGNTSRTHFVLTTATEELRLHIFWSCPAISAD